MAGSGEIICERRGKAGLIVLNRPQALNAITLGMVREMRKALDSWAADPQVTRIVLTGSGGKAFCAGGDIRQLYELGRAGRHEEALTFWREEYALNTLIKAYPKPYLSLIDGIVMGGGVGVSLHGRYRVAGERYLFAMPEVSIGFFPDVGASHALARLPDETGTYLALTGERLRTADALALGLVTHAVRSDALPGLQEALTAGEAVDALLERNAVDPGPPPLQSHRPVIARCFAQDTVPAILAALEEAGAAGSDFASRTAAAMRAKSPTSLAIALEQVRRGRHMTFEQAMAMEFRIVTRVIEAHDFYEGVRATLIDKDGRPNWRPASLDAVSPEMVERYFAGLGSREWTYA